MDIAATIDTETQEKRTADMPATFLSRRRDLVLVQVPPDERIDGSGKVFVVRPAKRIEFVNGQFSTDDLTEIEFLRAHDRFGDPGDGFMEVEPQAPLPEGELLDLAQAAAALDEEKVAEILERELATWQREIVLKTAEHTLEAIAQQRAKLDAAGGEE